MRLTNLVTRRIIERILHAENYRTEIVSLIDAEFLEYVIDFFQRVVEAKLRSQTITPDWYQVEFLQGRAYTADEIAIHAGLNKKTIDNLYGSARREVVIHASQAHYEKLYFLVQELVEQHNDLDVHLTIKFQAVSVDLSLSESLIVINALAVKRAQLRGGAWSTVGKQVEKPLMLTLCRLFRVPATHYILTGKSDAEREVDFFFIGATGQHYRCEVKLMGKGNPESADATIARDSHIFIADTLSELNKRQLTARGVYWVELNVPDGWQAFGGTLHALHIPHTPLPALPLSDLAAILDAVVG
ncbi:MAG: CfrBI family restriction endonuclease [Cyanobacteria bacterium M5B4]|nr:MAG: CfrBI family restriction endonuclease [Cyanobacteria bacterium M5B4]